MEIVSYSWKERNNETLSDLKLSPGVRMWLVINYE